MTFGSRTQERVLFDTLFYNHYNPSIPEKKNRNPLRGVSQATGASLSQKKRVPRASPSQCKIQHYALPWTTHLKSFLLIPILWSHVLENLAARLRALHILFQKQDRTGLASDHHK